MMINIDIFDLFLLCFIVWVFGAVVGGVVANECEEKTPAIPQPKQERNPYDEYHHD